MNNIKSDIQDEIVKSLPSPCHGLLNIAPRVGKTRIAINILKRDNPKSVLWVTPSEQLRDVDIPKEFNTWGGEDFLKRTTIICYNSLANHVGDYDYVILDEYQNVTVKNVSPLLRRKINYSNIIGLSGSHPKNFVKKEVLKLLKLKIISKIDIHEAVESKIISDYNINIIECTLNNTDKTIEAGNKDKRWMQTEAQAYQYLSNNIAKPFFVIKRMRFIYDSLSKEKTLIALLNKLKGRRLVFCSSIAQAERLGYGNTYHSKRDDVMLNEFINEKIDELYCVNAGSVGFTYKNVDHFVILQVDSDNKGNTTQKLARALLEQENYKANIWIICLVDTKDKVWLEQALQNFDMNKVRTVNLNDL